MTRPRLLVVGGVVAKHGAKRFEPAAALDEAIPVVVTDLVSEVAEHRAVGLAHLLTSAFAEGVGRLGDIDGDQAVVMTGEHFLFRGAALE